MAFRNSEETRREDSGVTYFLRPQIEGSAGRFDRLAIQTHFVQRGESYIELMRKYVAPLATEGDILCTSEKIIGMCQNNVVEMKDVPPGWWARNLSKFASRSAAGIGMDEPHKLQLAINLAGLPRILFACVCHVVGRLFGKRGVFYKVAGHGIAGIDGFYSHSSFDLYHTIAILNPRDPNGVCAELEGELGIPVYLVDANDLEREVLGRSPSAPYSDEVFLELIRDNPAGQSDELTPLILIRKA